MFTVDLTLKRAKRLRRPMTPQEIGLWLLVKNRQLGGFKFRRQHPVGPYILDFYCHEARLAVEIDGQAHWSEEQARHDAQRYAYLRARGIETLRLSAEFLKRPGAAADQILKVAKRRCLDLAC
jgi:very-short-patch-repair endonuclease